MLPLKGIIFLGLNAVRLLSMVALALVVAGTVVLMVSDSETYFTLRRNGLLGDSDTKCDYYPETDIPTTTWGVFWTELNRFWILCLCIVCFGSEIGHSSLSCLYQASLPILGPSFSTCPLGIIQVMISSSLLSHYLDGFPLVAPWLLFFVGILNFLAGLALGVPIKLRRSFLRSRRDMLTRGGQPDVEKLAPISDTVVVLAKNGMGAVRCKRQSAVSKPSCEKTGLLPRGGNVRSPESAVDLFAKPSLAADKARQSSGELPPKTDDEVLRWRARQENMRAEKEQEKKDGLRSVSAFSRHYQWNQRHSLVVSLPTPAAERDSLDVRIQHAQAGVSHDLTSPRRSTPAAGDVQRSLGYEASVIRKRTAGGFKRRTLVLSKMVQQVRRGSASAASAAASHYAGRKPRMPPMPVDPRAMASLWKPVGGPGPWEEVNPVTATPLHIDAPQASYQPGKANVKNIEVMTADDGASRYHSLPIADQFAR